VKSLLVFAACVFAATLPMRPAKATQQWVAWSYSSGGENPLSGPSQFVCTLGDDYSVTFDHTSSRTVGGSSASYWDLCFYNIWAACGTISPSLDLAADPYASFANGFVRWASDTPDGYVAPLMLGAMFNGNGAVGRGGDNYSPTQYGTIFLEKMWMGGYGHSYTPLSHKFLVTYAAVPEFSSSLPALLTALVGVAGLALRGRRR
jgi:hypothetical protein